MDERLKEELKERVQSIKELLDELEHESLEYGVDDFERRIQYFRNIEQALKVTVRGMRQYR